MWPLPERGGGEGGTRVVHGRNRMTTDRRFPIIPGRSVSSLQSRSQAKLVRDWQMWRLGLKSTVDGTHAPWRESVREGHRSRRSAVKHGSNTVQPSRTVSRHGPPHIKHYNNKHLCSCHPLSPLALSFSPKCASFSGFCHSSSWYGLVRNVLGFRFFLVCVLWMIILI